MYTLVIRSSFLKFVVKLLYILGELPITTTFDRCWFDALADDLRGASRNACSTKKARQILGLIAHDGVNVIQYQIERDYIIKSIITEFRT